MLWCEMWCELGVSCRRQEGWRSARRRVLVLAGASRGLRASSSEHMHWMQRAAHGASGLGRVHGSSSACDENDLNCLLLREHQRSVRQPASAVARTVSRPHGTHEGNLQQLRAVAAVSLHARGRPRGPARPWIESLDLTCFRA